MEVQSIQYVVLLRTQKLIDKTEMSFPNFSVDVKLQKTQDMKIKCDKLPNFQVHNSIAC